MISKSEYEKLEGYGECVEVLLSAIYHLILQPGDIVIDGGANAGLHTIPMAGMVSPAGRVYAYEPQRSPFTHMTNWAHLSGVDHVVRRRNVAIGGTSGEMTFFNHKTDSGMSSARMMNTSEEEWDKTTVQVVRVDDEPIPPPVMFIKMDLEGGERDALLGARNIVSRDKPIIAFENGLGWAAERFGYDIGDFFRFFSDLGYRIYDFLGTRATLDNFSDEFLTWNLVAIHEGNMHMGTIIDTISEFYEVFPSSKPARDWDEVMDWVLHPFEQGPLANTRASRKWRSSFQGIMELKRTR